MAQETSIFEIKVLGLAEFEQFLGKLNIAKNQLLNIAEAYRNIEKEVKNSVKNINAVEIQAEAERQARFDRRIANQKAKSDIANNKELNDIRVQNAKILGEERIATERMRQERLQRTKDNDRFNGSLLETNKILGLLGVSFGVTALKDFATNVFNAQSKVEALRLNLKSLLGDVSGANLFEGIVEFTTRTPFTIEQSIKGINQLVASMKAAGVSNSTIARDSIKIMESLGNSAAALGDVTGEKFGRLTYAFTQVQSAGRLMGTEVRQLTEVGLPVLALLAQQSGEKISDLQKRIKDGQVGFQEFSKAILSAGEAGGVFGSSMNIMSQTVSGKFAILTDTLFFGLARIGDTLSGSAKKIIDFTISLANALIGSSNAVENTISTIKTLIATYVGYRAILAISTTSILANTAAESASLVTKRLMVTVMQLLRGQITLSTIALGLETNAKIAGGVAANTFTVAELRAAAAATVLQRSLGVLAVVLGAALVAYQLFGKQQDEIASKTTERTAGLEKEKVQFNLLANAVLQKNAGTKTELELLARLKKEHPVILSGINNLKDAEARLKKENIESNAVRDYRIIKLAQLKAQFPEQLNGINDLATAEARLGNVLRQTNADYAVRRKLIINEIKQQQNDKLITQQLEEVVKVEEALKRVRKGGTNIVIGTSGATLSTTQGTIANLEKDLKERNNVILKNQQIQNGLVEQAFKEREKLNFKYSDSQLPPDSKKVNENASASNKAIKEYVESQILHNRRLVAESNLANAEQVSDKKRALAEMFKVELDSLKDRYGNSKKFDAERLQLETKFHKDKVKLDDDLNDKLKKSQAELTRSQKEQAKIRHEFERLMANQEAISTLSEQRDLLIAQATTEAEKLAIVKEFNKRIYDENRRFADENYKAKLREITDELSLLATQQSQNTAEGASRKTQFNILNPLNFSAQSLFSGDIDKEVEIKNNAIQIQVNDLYTKLLNLQSTYQATATKEKNAFDKEQADSTKKIGNEISDAQQKVNAQDLASRKKLFEAAKSIYKSMRLLALSELDSSIAIYEKLDTITGRRETARLKATREGAKNAFDGIKNLFESVKPINIKVGGNKTSIGDIFKGGDLADGLTKLGGQIGGKFGGALTKAASVAGKVAPILGGVIAAYKIFDGIMGAIEQNRLAKIKATQEAIIKANNKAIEQLNKDYAKLQKDLETEFNRSGQLINKEADIQTINEQKRYGKQLENLITNKDAIKRINEDYNADELRIRALYADGLKSTDEKIRLETEAIVDEMIANLGKKRNDALNDEIELERKRVAINKEADEAIVEIKKKGGEDVAAEIDKVNAKRQEDLDATRTYTETLLEINASYDAQIAEARANKDGLEISAVQAKIDAINALRQVDIDNLNATNLGLQEAESTNAANLNAIAEAKAAKEYQLKLDYDAKKAAAEKAYRQQLYQYEKANFEATRAIQLAELRVELAKAKRKIFGREKLLDAINEAIGEIQGLSFPEPSFKKGIDNTSTVGKGRNIDGIGGFNAILHPGEQVMNEKQMGKMTKANGGVRPTRDDVINSFVNFKQLGNIEPLAYNPFVIDKLINTNNLESEVSSLRKEMKDFARIVANKPTSVTNMDKNGYTNYIAGKNYRKEVRSQRFNHVS